MGISCKCENSEGSPTSAIILVLETRVGLLICDVTGHGVHAALITVAQRLLVDELKHAWNNPDLFLTEMNNRLCHLFAAVSHPYFVTACYAVLDSTDSSILFATAGHPLPIKINRATRSVSEFILTEDLKNSTEVVRQDWDRRSRTDRFKQWAARTLEPWL